MFSIDLTSAAGCQDAASALAVAAAVGGGGGGGGTSCLGVGISGGGELLRTSCHWTSCHWTSCRSAMPMMS